MKGSGSTHTSVFRERTLYSGDWVFGAHNRGHLYDFLEADDRPVKNGMLPARRLDITDSDANCLCAPLYGRHCVSGMGMGRGGPEPPASGEMDDNSLSPEACYECKINGYSKRGRKRRSTNETDALDIQVGRGLSLSDDTEGLLCILPRSPQSVNTLPRQLAQSFSWL